MPKIVSKTNNAFHIWLVEVQGREIMFCKTKYIESGLYSTFLTALFNLVN